MSFSPRTTEDRATTGGRLLLTGSSGWQVDHQTSFVLETSGAEAARGIPGIGGASRPSTAKSTLAGSRPSTARLSFRPSRPSTARTSHPSRPATARAVLQEEDLDKKEIERRKPVKQKLVVAVSIVRGLVSKDRPGESRAFELRVGGFERERHKDLEMWDDDDKFDEEMRYIKKDLQGTAIWCDTYKRDVGGIHTYFCNLMDELDVLLEPES